MEREIGRWNRATGITRPVAGQDAWEELWIGDYISCRIYTTDRAGVYLSVEGTVLWDKERGMYILHGKYTTGGESYTNDFPLHEIVRENVTFIRKATRGYGSQREIIFGIVDMLRAKVKKPTDIKEMVENLGGANVANQVICTDEDLQSAIDTLTYDMIDALISEIGNMGIVPSSETREAFIRE